MPTMTLAIPSDLKKRMDSFSEINWSAVARQSFLLKLNQMEILSQVNDQIHQENSQKTSFVNNNHTEESLSVSKPKKQSISKKTLNSEEDKETVKPTEVTTVVEEKKTEVIEKPKEMTEEDEKMLMRRLLLKRLAESEK